MDLKAKIASLSEIEKKTLKALKRTGQTLAQISDVASLNIDSVRRAVNWLEEKNLVSVNNVKSQRLLLTDEGKKALEKGVPERRMLDRLAGKKTMAFDETRNSAELNNQEFNVALGLNKRKNFIVILRQDRPAIQLTAIGEEELSKESPEQKTLDEIGKNKTPEKDEVVRLLVSRGLVEEKEIIERKAHIISEGEKALESKEFSKKRAYNIHDPVPEIFIGKKQPYVQFLNSIRRKLVALGFKEMHERLVSQEFYNFDVLFQPQNHPARTWTDTYQLKRPTHGKLPHKDKVKAVKDAHEHGGKTISRGWGYNWSGEIAQRLMPTAHGTAADARQMVEGVEFPRKYFVINRCFRPDVLDATHLIEFNQLDGFIVGPDLDFRNLLGVLKEFAMEIADAEKVRFYPDYYPFTEPSVQLSAKHPEMGWMEFAGAGIFRPEITESLGIKEPVLAWGMGVDRLAMFRLGINDIRHLFSEDLTWLRKSRMVID